LILSTSLSLCKLLCKYGANLKCSPAPLTRRVLIVQVCYCSSPNCFKIRQWNYCDN